MNQNELRDYFANIKYGSNEWYLYHHCKNEELAIKLIPISLFLFIIQGGFLAVIFVWIWWVCESKKNNRILDNNPIILQKRRDYMQAYLNGKR